jgi:hypothetical protein
MLILSARADVGKGEHLLNISPSIIAFYCGVFGGVTAEALCPFGDLKELIPKPLHPLKGVARAQRDHKYENGEVNEENPASEFPERPLDKLSVYAASNRFASFWLSLEVLFQWKHGVSTAAGARSCGDV